MNLDLKYIKIQTTFIRSIKAQVSISVFNVRATLFFHFMFFGLSWGKTYTRYSISTTHCVISYRKNCGRLGEGSGEEKIYALMSNSFSKKEMLTLQVCVSAGNI